MQNEAKPVKQRWRSRGCYGRKWYRDEPPKRHKYRNATFDLDSANWFAAEMLDFVFFSFVSSVVCVYYYRPDKFFRKRSRWLRVASGSTMNSFPFIFFHLVGRREITCSRMQWHTHTPLFRNCPIQACVDRKHNRTTADTYALTGTHYACTIITACNFIFSIFPFVFSIYHPLGGGHRHMRELLAKLLLSCYCTLCAFYREKNVSTQSE